MPKTKDAFAFRDFDGERILQRPFFKEWREKYHVDGNLTDAEILSTLAVTDSDELAKLENKNSILREIVDTLSALCDIIQKRHAGYHKGRLETYRRALMKKLPPTTEQSTADDFLIRSRWGREESLLGFYMAKVLPAIGDLRGLAAVYWGQSEKFLQDAYRRRFGARLRQAREAAGLTQKDSAEKIGLTTAGYAFYERGERELTILALTRLAKIFKISTDRLLGLK